MITKEEILRIEELIEEWNMVSLNVSMSVSDFMNGAEETDYPRESFEGVVKDYWLALYNGRLYNSDSEATLRDTYMPMYVQAMLEEDEKDNDV